MNNETINIYWVYFPGARDVIGNKTNFQLCYIPCEEKTKKKKAVKQINTCLWVIKAENKNKARKGNKDYWECCFIWNGWWRLLWEGGLLGPVEEELCRCTGRALLLQGGASANTLMPGCPCCLRNSKDFSGAGVGTTESGGDEVRTGADDEGQA